MSEHAAEAPKDGADKKEKKKKEGGGSNLLLVILGVVNFLGVAGLGAYLVLGLGQHPQVSAQPQAKDGDAAAPAEGEGHGEPAAEGEGHGEKPAEGEGHGEGTPPETHGEKHGATGGPLLALETIVTNLAEPDSDRYLKITVQLRITSESARGEVEAYLVPIRSQVLMFFSSLSLADLRGAEAKQTLQAKVKRLINETMPSSRVTQVYFTELVIQ